MARCTTGRCFEAVKLIWLKARLGGKVEGAGRPLRNVHITAAHYISNSQNGYLRIAKVFYHFVRNMYDWFVFSSVPACIEK